MDTIVTMTVPASTVAATTGNAPEGERRMRTNPNPRMAYDSRGPGYPSGGAAGYGGYGMPPPRGGHPYPSTRGGYPSRGVGGFPPYAASRGGSFGGYDPYYPPGVRYGFQSRAEIESKLF